jgi:hypothetical protein
LEMPGELGSAPREKEGMAKSTNGLGRVSIGGNGAGNRLMARGAWIMYPGTAGDSSGCQRAVMIWS